MKDYGKVYSSIRPQDIEITDSAVFLASNIETYSKEFDGHTQEGYEYNLVEYTKDEYLLNQSNKISSLEQELAAAKILLGVD